MGKAIFVDTTVCTACRGCQVACKQWHDLPAEQTTNRGTIENPADLSFNTYKLVRMREVVMDKKLHWVFFPEQCRHCLSPPCQDTAGEPGAIYTDEMTGAVLYTAETRHLQADDIIESCPYNIPRKSEDGTLAKCDLCNDRVHNGLLPACVQTCPTGAMHFGEQEEMRKLADERLAEVKKRHPNALLIDPDDVRVIYLVAFDPKMYYEHAMASHSDVRLTRHLALKKMFRPISDITGRLMQV